jgi:hypothetical protein
MERAARHREWSHESARDPARRRARRGARCRGRPRLRVEVRIAARGPLVACRQRIVIDDLSTGAANPA